MKYSITIKSAFFLEVCVGEYETFEKAKEQMAKFIVNLIDKQKKDLFNPWQNLKEDFPEEIKEILESYENTGTATFDGDIYKRYKVNNTYISANKNDFSIRGKSDKLGYILSIDTNAINMYDPDKKYKFTLIKSSDDDDNDDYDDDDYHGDYADYDELSIILHVNEVYNMISDNVRSRLEPVDLDDE